MITTITRDPQGSGAPLRSAGAITLIICSLWLAGCGDGAKSRALAPITVSLDVRAVNVRDEAVAGAAVTLEFNGRVLQATTGANGIASFGSLQATTATVTIEATDYEVFSEARPLNLGRQVWQYELTATGAWELGRAIVLGSSVQQRANDGSSLTFSVDVAMVSGANPEPLLTLTGADFRIYSIDCGWGGPRDCASDAAGNASGNGGIYDTDGIARSFELMPAPERRPWLAGVLFDRSSAGAGLGTIATPMKSFFSGLGPDDTIALTTLQYDPFEDSTYLRFFDPFSGDGTTFFTAIDWLAQYASPYFDVAEGHLYAHLIEAIHWTAAGAADFPGKDATLLMRSNMWLSFDQLNEAIALARDLGVRISIIGGDYHELTLRTGGFAMNLQDARQYAMIFGAMDRALAGELPFYRMQFTLTGGANTFVAGGNARVYMNIDTPSTIPNRGTYTHFDVAIP